MFFGKSKKIESIIKTLEVEFEQQIFISKIWQSKKDTRRQCSKEKGL